MLSKIKDALIRVAIVCGAALVTTGSLAAGVYIPYTGPINTSGLTISTQTVAGRYAAGTGAVQAVPLGSGLGFSAGTLTTTGTFTATAYTLNSGKFLGRTTASAGTVEEITPSAEFTFAGGAFGINTVAWTKITSTPTTLAGYGITNGALNGAVGGSGITMATGKMLGRATAGTGAIEEISIGSGLTNSGGTLSTTGTYAASGYTMASGGKLLGRNAGAGGVGQEISIGSGLNISSTTLQTTGTYTATAYTLSTSRLLGRTTAGSGVAEEISAGAGLAMSAGSLATSGAYTANGFTLSTARLLGRTTAATGAAEEISTGCAVTLASATIKSAGITRNPQTSNYSAAASDCSNLIDATSGTWTLSFTAAATLGANWWAYIRNSGTGDITLDPNASETIDGLTSYVMYPGEARLVWTDGSSFFTQVLHGFARTFNASGTFTKPPGYTYLDGYVWGGGGSGGKTTHSTGGGGGGCTPVHVLTSTVNATETVTIGVGGAGQSVNATDGNPGGTTTVGSWATAYGGAGGGLIGGGGGGATGAGVPVTGVGGSNGGGTGGNGAPGGDAVAWGGGGGGGSGSVGGKAFCGGGGGGGTGGGNAGGTSVLGGAGGPSSASGTGAAGSQPGGGSGGSSGAGSGKGGDGAAFLEGIV